MTPLEETMLNVPASAEVDTRTLNAEGLPLALLSRRPTRPLVDWVKEHRALVEALLLERGAVLLRGFDMSEAQGGFEQLSRIMVDELLTYVYRSTPRTAVGGNVYTATEYPPAETIPQHNENAYSRDWPLTLMFFCALPAQSGGETPLSRTPGVTRRISPFTREKFKKLGVMYQRNYRDHVDLHWKVVFQTDNREDVDRFCREHAIDVEWRADGTLRTRQVCQGMALHPTTKEELWFNQAHLFHPSSQDPKTRKALAALFKEDELPRNAYYGDGSPIEPEVLAEIREAFTHETFAFPWQKDDVLLVDNMLVGHGRNPFKGPRRVLVSMGKAFSALPGGRVFPALGS